MPTIALVAAKVARKPEVGALFHEAFEHDIQLAIDPNLTVTRYDRTWRFSRAKRWESHLVGKLGFIHEEQSTEGYYDEAEEDFVERPFAAHRSHYSQWVIDLRSQIIVFEIKPPEIKIGTFLNNFKALLDKRPEFGFTVELVELPERFYEWARTVERITTFKAELRAPNPSYESRLEAIQQFVGETHAERATVEVRTSKQSERSLEVEQSILGEIVEYQRYGYAAVRAEGYSDGAKSVYDSEHHIQVERLPIEDHASQESVWDAIIRAFGRLWHPR